MSWSSMVISSPSSRMRRASDLSAILVALTGSAALVSSGRQAAQASVFHRG